MGLSVSGLGGSGLDTNSIVSQLMQIEQQPQNLLKSQQSDLVSQKAAWGTLNGSLSSLKAATDALSTTDNFNSMIASGNAPDLTTVSASSSAVAGAVSFTVNRLATAGQYASQSLASSSTVIGAGTFAFATGATHAGITGLTAATSTATGTHTLAVAQDGSGNWTITEDGDSTKSYTVQPSDLGNAAGVQVGDFTLKLGASLTAGTVTVGVAQTSDPNSTLSDLTTQIGKANGPATGAVLDSGNTTNGTQLLLTGKNTGASNDVLVGTNGLTGFDQGFRTLNAAQDAELTIGDITVDRPTNNITDAIPGVTLGLTKADPTRTVTVTVSQDISGLSSKASNIVSSLNALLGTVSSLTAYSTDGSTSGPLSGDLSAQGISDHLHDLMGNATGGSSTTKILSQLGIQVQKDGTYTFDQGTFQTQLAADPQGVAGLLSSTASAISTYVGQLTDPVNGVVASRKASYDAQNQELQSQIDDWTVRLAQIQDQYNTAFTAMDSAVSTLKNQGSWLQSMFDSLPSMSSSSSSSKSSS